VPAKVLEDSAKRSDFEQMKIVIDELQGLVDRMAEPAEIRSSA